MFDWLTGIIITLLNLDYQQLYDDYGISAFIIVSSFFLARYVYNLLQNTICQSLLHTQKALTVTDLSKITAVFSLLIPILGIDISTRYLLFPGDDNKWIYTSFLVVYQIFLSLLLIYIIEPLLKSWAYHYVQLYKKIDFHYAEKLTKKLENRRDFISNSLKFLLLMIPAMTITTVYVGLDNIIWMLPVIVLLLSLLGYFRLRAIAQKQLLKIEKANKRKKDIFIAPVHEPMDNDPDFKERIGIINLFLEIFKKQLQAPDTAHAYFVQVEYNPFREYFTYELRVKIKDDWEFRRMSIGRLGDSNTSRCKCFYAIYNEYIVVKIPAKKTTKLKEYIYTIKKEQNIAQKTQIQECITPNVSIILKYITRSEKDRGVTSHYTEDFYLRLLFNSSTLHNYLKVNGQYAYFMDLSQYYFVEYAMKSIHSIEDKITKEISKQFSIEWDLLEFEYRYGSNIVPLVSMLRGIFNDVESEYKKDVEASESLNSNPLHQFELEQWFFSQLAGQASELHKKIPPGIAEHIKTILVDALENNITIVEVYHQIVRDKIFESEFFKNKVAMEGIVINMLRLLTHLREKKVAMRDIKPDNLLLAGDKNDFPDFLDNPDAFKIGLIDVETAAYSENVNSSSIKQPLLGGTPHYATPSHFFSNDVLAILLYDLQMTFHLQDWNAVMVIIYKLITGEFLFDKTAKKISYVIQTISKSQKKGADITDIFKDVSKKYWDSALLEFDQKMTLREQLLKEAHIHIPIECVDFLFQQLSKGKMTYRLSYQQQQQILTVLKQKKPVISVYILLEIIFSIILQHMYRPEWHKE